MPAQSGAGELAEGVPEHLEPLAADVEEHCAVWLPGLGVQLGRGHGVWASAANQSISGQIRVSKGGGHFLIGNTGRGFELFRGDFTAANCYRH